jgi:hypothetical protein
MPATFWADEIERFKMCLANLSALPPGAIDAEYYLAAPAAKCHQECLSGHAEI